MKIKFIKDHSTGIAIGRIVGVDEKFGSRMIAEGYAEEVKDEAKPKRRTTKKVESTKVEKATIENKKVEPIKEVEDVEDVEVKPVKEVKNVISTVRKRRKTKKD